MSGQHTRSSRSVAARNASRNYEGKRMSYTELSTSSSESDEEKLSVLVRRTREKALLKKQARKRARLIDASDDEEDDNDDDDGSTSDEEQKESTDSDQEDVKRKRNVKERKKQKKDHKKKKSGRRKIKDILGDEDLKEETREAAKEEMERLKRLKELEEIDEEDEEEDVIASPEKKAQGPSIVFQKNPHVEVSPYLASQLRPHQIEGVRFIWKNLIESTERAKTSPGGGCILAHCMGLGKTLQTIASVHTFLKCKHLSFKRVLVVSPLNTVRNWIAEFEQWCDRRDTLNLYNFALPKNKKARISMLKLWQKNGGVLILGYDMYRIMLSRIKYAPWKKTAYEALVDPGPDIVVCDEGHMLKNSESHISKQINKIKTRRRLVLTGTPLQNNLVEYHCMVNFVKPDLLGSLKEFRNRFVNPIVNGQHIDSTERDVKLMKKRSHVLHQMLEGFVQRKDYTALKPYLSSKFEYVLKVRLTPLQIKLYKHYLNTMTNKGVDSTVVNSNGKGATLFTDYQNLMRVWTHPKSLLLHTVKREKLLARQELNDFISRAETGINSESEWVETSSSEEDYWGRKKKSKIEDQEKKVIEISSSGSECEEDDKSTSSDSEEVISPRRKKSRVKRKAVIKASSGESEKEEQSDESGEESDGGRENEENLPERCTRSTRSQQESDRKKRYRLRCAESSSEGEEDNDVELQLQGTPKKPTEPEWYNEVLPEDKKSLEDYQNSLKIVLLFEILRLSEERKEKVLVFSQSLISLDLIEEMLEFVPRSSLIQSSSSSSEEDVHIKHRRWKKNVDYFRMDGATQGHHRQKWINAFNDKNDTRSRLFLISTKAGSLGVNLVGANRVVIFDASWNPSHDTQSMFRVYRFGQKKKCYIYRFIAEGTMEEKIYQRQVNKQSLAFRVVDEQQINRHFTASSLAEMYTFEPTLPDATKSEPTPVVPKDDVLAEILLDPRTRLMISSFHEHDSLLDHQVDEELTEEERKAAWEEYEMAKATGYEDSKPNQNDNFNLNMTNSMNIIPGSFNYSFMSSKETSAKTIENTAGLIARLSKVVANAFYQYQVCEVKSVESIIKHLKETPLYGTSNEETIKAIAKEVNYRLEMQRSEKFTTFQNLQLQLRQLQGQYFKLIAGGNLAQVNPGMHLPPNYAVMLPSKADLLMQLSGSSNLINGSAVRPVATTTTTISEIIEIDEDDSQGTSETVDK